MVHRVNLEGQDWMFLNFILFMKTSSDLGKYTSCELKVKSTISVGEILLPTPLVAGPCYLHCQLIDLLFSLLFLV